MQPKFRTFTTLFATTGTILSATPALAQFPFPAVQLDAVGSSEGADMNGKVQGCIGVDTLINNAPPPVVLFDFTASPTLICSVGDDIYNAGPANTYTGNYLITGSALARQQWRKFTNQIAANPFGFWPNVQYALSAAPVTSGDIIDYGANAAPQAGPGIQIPLYVVPIAFAYNGSYGKNAANQTMNFNNKFPIVGAGGQRLKKATYCGIWNGTITNWNALAIRTDNGNQALFDPLTDTASRWATEGAPIRLIGNANSSGETSVFTRALAAQCGVTVPNGGTNKFERSAGGLPYNSPTIDISPLTSSTPYKPVNSGNLTLVAGTTNAIGGVVFDQLGTFCDYTALVAGICSAPLANPGVATPGMFIVADGTRRVAQAIATTSPASSILLPSGVTIDGKFGYVGGDYVAPVVGRTLFSAALQVGSGAAYAIANTANSVTAVSPFRPPESTAASGAFNRKNGLAGDQRVVLKDVNDPLSGTDPVDRADPRHWINVLYPLTGPTLANPATGYPVVGTINMLTYTCFGSNAKRHGLANFIQYTIARITKKNAIGGTSGSINLSANTFIGTAPLARGILTQANVGVMPIGWRTAYVETFFKKSSQTSASGAPGTLGSLNLWLQTAQPLTPAGSAPTSLTVIDDGAGGIPGVDNRNPQCVVGGIADDVSPSLPGA
ncbi:MAG: substrate-binding domain-containing protein [Sphingomonadaceae bacterium]